MITVKKNNNAYTKIYHNYIDQIIFNKFNFDFETYF